MLRMGLSRVFGDRGNGTLGGLKGFTRPSSNMAANRAPRNVPPRDLDTPRTPDHVAGFFAGFAAKPCFFAAAGQQKKYTVTRGF